MSKSNSRRTFIKKSAIAGIGIPLMGSILLNCNSGSKKEVTTSTNKKLKILILGGTSFLGPHQPKIPAQKIQ